jgi:hypothetical protein
MGIVLGGILGVARRVLAHSGGGTRRFRLPSSTRHAHCHHHFVAPHQHGAATLSWREDRPRCAASCECKHAPVSLVSLRALGPAHVPVSRL